MDTLVTVSTSKSSSTFPSQTTINKDKDLFYTNYNYYTLHNENMLQMCLIAVEAAKVLTITSKLQLPCKLHVAKHITYCPALYTEHYNWGMFVAVKFDFNNKML